MSYQEFKNDVEIHGEVHATVDGVDAEMEFRNGTTTFFDDIELIVVEGPDTDHRVPFDSILHWYEPMQLFHEG